MCAEKKQFQDETTNPTTDKQTNNWPTIVLVTEKFRIVKKNRSWSELNRGLRPS